MSTIMIASLFIVGLLAGCAVAPPPDLPGTSTAVSAESIRPTLLPSALPDLPSATPAFTATQQVEPTSTL
ncbi:MAG: hypothetical protein MUC85_11690 [Anaerolineales bacterium]|nr:hypothetical protein [Anaerolineales bacterium]